MKTLAFLCLHFALQWAIQPSGLQYESLLSVRSKLGSQFNIWEYSYGQYDSGEQLGKSLGSSKKKNLTEETSTLEGNLRSTKSELNQVRHKIFSWYKKDPQGSEFSYTNNKVGDQIMSETNDQTCRVQTYSFTNPTPKLFDAGFSLQALFPGSLIQSKYLSKGTESLVIFPVPSSKKQPIKIGGKGQFQMVQAKSASAQDVNAAIKQAIRNSKGSTSAKVIFDMSTSSEIKNVIGKFNFNAKVLEALDLSGQIGGNSKKTSQSYLVTLAQGIGSFYPVMVSDSPDEISDPTGVFFSDAFTVDDLNILEEIGYCGSSNPPLYISQVDYGRVIVVSVEINEQTKKIYGSLHGKTELFSGDVQAELNSLFNQQNTKVFSVGPFSSVEIQDLRSGKWTQFFGQLSLNSSSMQAMRPVSFGVRDFKLRPISVSNYLEYDLVKCDAKPTRTITVQLTDVWNTAAVNLKRSGQNSFNYLLFSSGSGSSVIFDITPYLTNMANDEIRVSNSGGRRHWYSPWSRRVRLIVQVDGVNVYNEQRDCSWCHSSGEVFTCSVNKYLPVDSAVRCR